MSLAGSFSTTNAAAAANPAARVRTLVELESASDVRYYLTTEPTSWSGRDYQGRVLDPGQFEGALGTAANAIPTVKTVSVRLANADGWFSRWRPDEFHLQRLLLREVFLDGASGDPVRTQAFDVTGGRMLSAEDFQLDAEDLLAPYRRRLVPRSEVLITRSMYPNIGDGADGLGRPVPVAFGRSMVPLYLVDQSSSDVYVGCVGSATVQDSGLVVTAWFGGFSILYSADGIAPWSHQYAHRQGVPVTEIVVADRIGAADASGRPVKRYAELIVGSQDYTPEKVLLDLLLGRYAGVCADPTIVDSPSLAAAESFYLTHSMFFDGAIIDQRPLEQWLGDWQHDSLTRLVLREALVLQPQNSRAAQGSFWAGNVGANTLRFEDANAGAEESRRVVYYRDRTRDPFPADAVPPRTLPGTFERWNAGAATEVEFWSPFIGRPSLARRAVQFWAKSAAATRRRYTLDSTIRVAPVEEGDLVTLTHSLVGATNQLCQVTRVTRRAGLYSFELAETSHSIFKVDSEIWPDPPFGFRFFERIVNTAESYAIAGSGNPFGDPINQVIVGSHRLGFGWLPGGAGATPIFLRPILAFGPAGLAATSLMQSFGGFTTNDSTFIVNVQALTPTRILPNPYFAAWDLFV